MSSDETRLRDELISRRERFAQLATARGQEEMVELLRRVDAALARFETPDWGLCTLCKDPIESDQIQVNPLLSICLECLTPEQRQALERDLVGANQVQRALLPPPELTCDGWQMAWIWEPLGAVSGDYVDLLDLRAQGSVPHLLLGDVAGKGVAASLLQSHLHALFRALAKPQQALGELLAQVNRLFFQATGAASYATLLAARLHEDGSVDLANAGHPRPLLADRRGVRPVEGADLPLGLFAESSYTCRQIQMASGDTLLFYSDGWTEAVTEEGEYGVGRAAAAMARAATLPLSQLLAACREDMEAYLAQAPRPDDFSLLALRRT